MNFPFEPLVHSLKACRNDQERLDLLSTYVTIDRKAEWKTEDLLILHALKLLDEDFSGLDIDALLFLLRPVEQFYKEIGGILGYHSAFLSCLQTKAASHKTYHRPQGIDLSSDASAWVREGIANLPFLAEMYPVGGAADRLNLSDPITGQSLPAAKLMFCGHTLLEGLIRDVQAREYLYYKMFGKQITMPIAMMTSPEKENHRHIMELCEVRNWFGRPKGAFKIFCQPVVPTLNREGKWCKNGEGMFILKPGGHGVIWKAAQAEGVFDWLERLCRTKILVRQINNPIAGVDHGLLSFTGVGFRENKSFGFASCPREVGAAEGMNVLVEEEESLCLTSIEYCDFATLGIADVPQSPSDHYSQFPSNTNILFGDITAIKEAVSQCPIPGMLVNFKTISYTNGDGSVQQLECARLESTMQNLADCFAKKREEPLDTFLTYNSRRKTISATKKIEAENLLETPEGCFQDMQRNAHELLTDYCRMSLPSFFLFTYHPALGPLFSLIGQKIRGGKLSLDSELKLEIAEVDIENLVLEGSLHVIAENILGHLNEQRELVYSENVGSICLDNVRIVNRGINTQASNIYWKLEVERHECCTIILRGHSQFIASNLTLYGDMQIEVEDGWCVTAYEEEGKLLFNRELLNSKKKRQQENSCCH